MHLKDHDLLQLDEEYIKKLGANNPAALTNLTTTLLDDLIEARNRLNQNPSNSSRPSGSMPPWELGKTETEPPSDGYEPEKRRGQFSHCNVILFQVTLCNDKTTAY
ncbi:MAG TPA: hypothetical protein HPP65_04300 [Gammaproteobacteria bacterium]|jgi:hypothetical protein|nr:hypothetical protein [Gammaproteobacteria bacterium]HIJ33609.1 hypothetical protein [Gammaproteobacteria bacterium]